jgi:hypothetical protein
MESSAGDMLEAGPSIAVQMVGLNSVPVAGDEFYVCENESEVGLCPPPGRSLHLLGLACPGLRSQTRIPRAPLLVP